ncbi:MAG: hypothetical protein AB8B91_04295 [Rubripirellula sp.]
MITRFLITAFIASAFSLAPAGNANAQTTITLNTTSSPQRFINLEDQLRFRLRAVTEEQKNYLRFVVQQVRLEKLDVKLVVAVERYAINRRPDFPFPFFERAIRYEANKRGVALPTVKQFASTKVTR